MHRVVLFRSLAALAGLLLIAMALQYEPVPGAPIASGPGYDDRGVLLSAAGRLLVVFQRLEGAQNDLYVTTSEDDAVTWSDPLPISVGAADDRVGALVQLGDGTLVLFYTSNADGLYRVHRATSGDGVQWTRHGAIDLHQLPASPIDPHVIVEDDGRLTMVYQLLTGSLYVAQSSDNGATWDEAPTRIGPAGAVAPRIAHTSDGGYLLTYHMGSADLDLYAQLSEDAYAWEGDPMPISVGGDSRDGHPLLLNDGTLAVFYALATEDAPADIYYRASEGGVEWDVAVQVTEADLSERGPFAVPAGADRRVYVLWSQETASDSDYDIYFQADLDVRPLPTPTWTPGPPTATPTATVFLSPTSTPTWTPVPTRTPSPTPSRTPTQTSTPTPITPTATPTAIPTPTQTPTLVPRLSLIPGSYSPRVSPGEPITITWQVQTNRGADVWVEWGPRLAEYEQRHDFAWIPGGIYDFEYAIIAPSRPRLYFRVTAVDDVHTPISWPGQVQIAAHAVYVPMIKRAERLPYFLQHLPTLQLHAR
ncbi:MAG: hypothetical protein MAG451_00469 [Anaerolineales bacterium]|nr:hypothetical protein [Anaerolineales bacterium]